MNRSKNDKRLMHLIDADSGRSCTRREVDSGSVKLSLGKLLLLAVSAWVLTLASPAVAQDTEEKTAAPPTAAQPEAVPPPPEAPAVEDPEAPLPEEMAAPRRGPASEKSLKEVVVTGYRKSLGAALNKKQGSTAQVDAIVAEDMADFPDLNLADSLQRIPGISVTRTSGEGGRVTVRGLSGHYTRTRLNGMDAQASDVDNTTREFDFNLFASELFNSILIHKTASAELGEGSLGSVIDLGTGRPFSFKKGLSIVAGAQGNYNDLSKTVRPRLTGLLNYHAHSGLWGATASVAYSKTRNDTVASDTVRWGKARFKTVEGVSCVYPSPLPDGFVKDPGCEEVADAFHARIPRYIENETVSERLGVTGGLQFKPFSLTEIRLDGLFAKYDRTTNDKTIEVLFRGNEGGMAVKAYDVKYNDVRFGKGNNDLTYLAVDDTWVRSESTRGLAEQQFYQLTLAIDQEFTSSVYAKALAGRSVSRAHRPHNTAMMYDIRDYDKYSYDYRQSSILPTLSYAGQPIDDATQFTLTEVRDQQSTTKNTFDTAELKFYWEIISALRLATGATFKRMSHDTYQKQRDGQVCGLGLYDCDVNNDGTPELLGPKGEADLSTTTNYRGEVGAGSNTNWSSPSIDGWVDRLHYYDVPLKDDLSRTRKVKETNFGGFLQADGEIGLGSAMRLNYNLGVQYVQTRQTSGGNVAVPIGDRTENVFTEVKRPAYHDWLPSGNLAFWPIETLVVRAAAAQVMARPLLANLSPGGSVDSFQFKVNFQNPLLEPTRALALDASVEWYFQKESVFSLALFRKDIDSFPITELKKGTFASTGLPSSVIAPTSPAEQNQEGTCGEPTGCWDITRLINGPGAVINGLEVGFQAPFSAFYGNLPPFIRGLGVIANVTLVDSKVTYTYDKDNKVDDRLFGLSPRAFNATLYYDSSKFGARISVAHRSDYLSTAGTNLNENLFEFTHPSTRFDFSSKYKIIDQLEVSVEMLNLTNAPEHTGVDIDADRLLRYAKTGRNFLLGARYTH